MGCAAAAAAVVRRHTVVVVAGSAAGGGRLGPAGRSSAGRGAQAVPVTGASVGTARGAAADVVADPAWHSRIAVRACGPLARSGAPWAGRSSRRAVVGAREIRHCVAVGGGGVGGEVVVAGHVGGAAGHQAERSGGTWAERWAVGRLRCARRSVKVVVGGKERVTVGGEEDVRAWLACLWHALSQIVTMMMVAVVVVVVVAGEDR